MSTDTLNSNSPTLPTIEQIQWAYQACASPSFSSFTPDEKTATLDVFLRVVQVLYVRFVREGEEVVRGAERRRREVLEEIEEAEVEYGVLRGMVGLGFDGEGGEGGEGERVECEREKEEVACVEAIPKLEKKKERGKLVRRKRTVEDGGVVKKKAKGVMAQLRARAG